MSAQLYSRSLAQLSSSKAEVHKLNFFLRGMKVCDKDGPEPSRPASQTLALEQQYAWKTPIVNTTLTCLK